MERDPDVLDAAVALGGDGSLVWDQGTRKFYTPKYKHGQQMYRCLKDWELDRAAASALRATGLPVDCQGVDDTIRLARALYVARLEANRIVQEGE